MGPMGLKRKGCLLCHEQKAVKRKLAECSRKGTKISGCCRALPNGICDRHRSLETGRRMLLCSNEPREHHEREDGQPTHQNHLWAPRGKYVMGPSLSWQWRSVSFPLQPEAHCVMADILQDLRHFPGLQVVKVDGGTHDLIPWRRRRRG